MMKRSGKFYRKNEVEVMESLGLKPTKNSGSGWIEKEDGQSEHVICQLKSTDAQSIKINKKDIDTLEHNAAVSHKIPVFSIQFLSSNQTYLLVSPDNLVEAAKYIETGEYTNTDVFLGVDLSEHEDWTSVGGKVIKSSSRAREQFNREKEEKFRKVRKSAT